MEDKQRRITQTDAKNSYFLSQSQLDNLEHVKKPNRKRKGSFIKLFSKEDCEKAAMDRWGSMEGLENERRKRQKRRTQKLTNQKRKTPTSQPAKLNKRYAILRDLPDVILERIRIEKFHPTASGSYVLYVCMTALRVDENPALDSARHLASRLNLPLLITFILWPHHHATRRRLQFELECIRDVQNSLPNQSVVIGGDFAQNDLQSLAASAHTVITEHCPTNPYMQIVQFIKEKSAANLFMVDTACVIPMQVVGKGHNRAYLFRNATKSLLENRIMQPYPILNTPLSLSAKQLPSIHNFDLSALSDEDILAMIITNPNLNEVKAVSETYRGGLKAAENRWEKYKRHGLRAYSSLRNQSTKPHAVSRMSAYLHYGCISAFKLAREAHLANASKFIDELIIWRELSYAFCCYQYPDLQWGALPKWASTYWEKQPKISNEMDFQAVKFGKTGDPFWDAAQSYLVETGELHNNNRMTWGKALQKWYNPKKALNLITFLNHHFALDGLDPCSYGGLLWCFGQFDGPKNGRVRPRPTSKYKNSYFVRQKNHIVTMLSENAI